MTNLLAAIAVLSLSGCVVYTVETGNVALERTLGSVDHDEIGQGLHFNLPLITTALEFSAKEIAIDFNHLI